MNKKLGFGIVGAGMIAPIHADAINKTATAGLLAFSSKSKEKGAMLAQKYGVKYYEDLDGMLKDESIDCISICTPSGTHLEIAQRAARAGKHVIVEKPVDISLSRAGKLIDECRINGVKLGTVFQMRYNKSSLKAKQIMNEKRLGDIILADACMKFYRPPEYYTKSNWKGTAEIDGGAALINQAIHGVDLLLWLAGDVKSVYAICKTRRHSINSEDTVTAVLEYQSGACGVIEAATSVYPDMQQEISIHGMNGTLILAGTEVTYIKQLELMDGTNFYEPQTHDDSLGGPHHLQYEDFVDAIINDREPMINGPEGIKALELVRAVYRSAGMGKSVSLPLTDD